MRHSKKALSISFRTPKAFKVWTFATLLGAVWGIFLILSSTSRMAYAQGTPPALTSSTGIPSTAIPTPSVIPTAKPVSYEDLLGVHKQVLDNVQNTFNAALLLLSVVGIAGTGLITYLAQRSLTQIDNGLKKANELEQKYAALSREDEKLRENIENQTERIAANAKDNTALREESLRLQDQFRILSSNVKLIQQLQTYYQVDFYTTKMFSPDQNDQETATLSLIELSTPNNAQGDIVARCRCAYAFARIPDYPHFQQHLKDRVIEHLHRMVEKDEVAGVCAAAKYALAKLKNKEDKTAGTPEMQ